MPTRELAIQIEQQIQGFAYFLGTTSLALYGGGDGTNFTTEKNAIKGSTDIVVATPGKLISHLNVGSAKFDKLQFLILDEADKMLDMGFYEDINRIISHIPHHPQTLMFSATMPPKIRTLAKQILQNPEEIALELSKPAEGVLQAIYLAYEEQKIPLIIHLLNDKKTYTSILIFTSTKSKISAITNTLKRSKFKAEGISSDLEQKEREEVLIRFRSKQTQILVATDVISRGIDIKNIELIINFDAPHDAEDYVHRVGRTARANTTGVAITLVKEKDIARIHRIEKLIEKDIHKLPLPESIGKGPEWKEFQPHKKNRRNFPSSKNKRKPFKKNKNN